RAPRGVASMAAVGAVLGLGFLTRRPVALLLPSLGLVLLAARRGEQRLRPSTAGVAAAVAVFTVVGLSWFAAVARREGLAPLEYFFLRENLERFAGETYDAGRSPLFYVWTYFAAG